MGACVKVTVPVLFVNTCMSIKLQTAASSLFCSFAYGCVEDFKLPNRIMMPSEVVYRAVQHKKGKTIQNYIMEFPVCRGGKLA
jgi:hypothetical protein